MAGTAKYLINVSIGTFLDHNQEFYYYQHGGSFEMAHFFHFLFPGVCLTSCIMFFDRYIIIYWHWQIK